MKARFFLFAEDRETLERRVTEALHDAGELLDVTSLADVIARFDPGEETIWRGGTSNPFFLVDPDTEKRLFPAEEEPAGWGVPLAGEAGEVAALAKAIRNCDDSDDPLRRCTLGGEFGAGVLVEASHWQNWSSGTGRGRSFATRREARRLIGADTLEAANLKGNGVRVLVVDRGLSRRYVEELGGAYGNGFDWDPGTGLQHAGEADAPFEKTPREHGALMARSILDLAPEATLWDLPLLPPQIRDVTSFALSASFAYFAIKVVTSVLSQGPWVVVNAWGIDDRFGEDIWNDYAANPYHPLNVWIGSVGQSCDVIFAAGNSGQFHPSRDAGPYDRGPGRSIFGGNAGGDVTSVGAVRSDGMWIGTSSQGPGPFALGDGSGTRNEKPDLCAPGWFLESGDRALLNSGTSTACAVTAGVVAALRSPVGGWPDLAPSELRGILRDTARRDWQTGWNGRMGAGILNAPRLLDALDARQRTAPA